ncbi:MAG: Hsp33 family molecular chaperone HslO [Deferrisomatales bacterium]|nr:Hsp33 family molecular chaperone HslO [Deferrisomatales bacterium]
MTQAATGDHLVRGLVEGINARVVACVTTELVHEACRLQGTLPSATVALGRALSAAALMVALLKDKQRVSLKFEGSGPLRKVIAEADADGAVRGTVGDPQIDLPRSGDGIAVAPALGRAGFLTVRKDLGLKQPYSGTVQLWNSEIAADLAYYFTESEQLPSAVGLGVFLDGKGGVAAAGGFLLQALPPSDPEAVEALAHHADAAPPLSELLLQGMDAKQLLAQILGALPFRVLERRPLRFRCSCSRERVEQALVSLGPEQLGEMIAAGEDGDIGCEFCRRHYVIAAADLARLLHRRH